jgi:hypothetical protein
VTTGACFQAVAKGSSRGSSLATRVVGLQRGQLTTQPHGSSSSSSSSGTKTTTKTRLHLCQLLRARVQSIPLRRPGQAQPVGSEAGLEGAEHLLRHQLLPGIAAGPRQCQLQVPQRGVHGHRPLGTGLVG